MRKFDIPRKSIYRLSIYHRCLQLLRDNGTATVSSKALAKAAGVKPTQLRKDLTYFGQFGTRGLGYNVDTLIGAIDEVLGTARLQPVILVGVGNLGTALLRYKGFNKEGFEFVGAFDLDPDRARAGLSNEIPLLHYDKMVEVVRVKAVRLAILAVPAPVAQGVANDLVDAGIQALLNFSPTVLEVPDRVQVNNVDLAVQLEHLSYFTS